MIRLTYVRMERDSAAERRAVQDEVVPRLTVLIDQLRDEASKLAVDPGWKSTDEAGRGLMFEIEAVSLSLSSAAQLSSLFPASDARAFSRPQKDVANLMADLNYLSAIIVRDLGRRPRTLAGVLESLRDSVEAWAKAIVEDPPVPLGMKKDAPLVQEEQRGHKGGCASEIGSSGDDCDCGYSKAIPSRRPPYPEFSGGKPS